MIYIRKGRTPDVVKQEAKKIMYAPENAYAMLVLPKDTKKLRDLFEQMPKDEIRNALCREQHGLCAYCMGRIDAGKRESVRIEHYQALSENKELALDYRNYLGVCFGGEKEKEEKPHILCCDAARSEKSLTINPWDKRQMEAIGYNKDGRIFVKKNKGLDSELVEQMQKDIDDVLVLNGEKDETGKVIHDTATKLVAKRRSICESVFTQFDRWDKKKCLTPEYLKDVIERLEKQLSNDAVADEYIGVRLYFYKRKYEKLKRQRLKR